VTDTVHSTVPAMIVRSATFQRRQLKRRKSTTPRTLPGAVSSCSPIRSPRLLAQPARISAAPVNGTRGNRSRDSAIPIAMISASAATSMRLPQRPSR